MTFWRSTTYPVRPEPAVELPAKGRVETERDETIAALEKINGEIDQNDLGIIRLELGIRELRERNRQLSVCREARKAQLDSLERQALQAAAPALASLETDLTIDDDPVGCLSGAAA
jgi:FtsZ-binding cell division protein ZapB